MSDQTIENAHYLTNGFFLEVQLVKDQSTEASEQTIRCYAAEIEQSCLQKRTHVGQASERRSLQR